MEILIKAKQANNPLFDFLNQNGYLNAFYKHTLQAMKDGNYPTDIDRPENICPSNTNETTSSLYQNYYSASQSVGKACNDILIISINFFHINSIDSYTCN